MKSAGIYRGADRVGYRSVNDPSFKEMVQHANPGFSVPVHETLKNHTKYLAEAYRQLPERHEKSDCSLMINGAKSPANVF
jgi:hypothetical protein